MENKKISIIIPMLNEENYISGCIESILNCDYNQEYIEIVIIDSMSTDNSRTIVDEYILEYKNIQCYVNPKIYTPFAFNMGINNSSGEYIFIVSAHCKYDKNYFTILVKYALELNADAVGAVSKTDVLNNTFKSNSIKSVLSNRFGVGNSYFRVGVDEITEVDAISGCYHRRVFEKYGLYNEKLIRNQDIELNKRIKNSGGRLYLIPYTSYTYFVRENFTLLAKNNYSNGFWNILTAYYTKTLKSLSFRHFIPLLFILSLFIPLIFSLVLPQLLWLTVLSLISYITLVIIMSLKLRTNNNSFFYLVGSFLTLHFSYGIGSVVGVFSTIKKHIKGNT